MLQTEVQCYLHCFPRKALLPAFQHDPCWSVKSRARAPWQLFTKAPTEWRRIIVLPQADSSSLSLPRPRINAADDRMTSDLVNLSVFSLSCSVKKFKCCGGQYFCIVLDRLRLELVTQSFVNRLDFSVVFFVFLLPALGSGSQHSKELVFRNYLLYVKL